MIPGRIAPTAHWKDGDPETERRMRYWREHPVEFAEFVLMGLTKEEVEADKPGKRLEPETKKMLFTIGKYDYVSIHAGRGVTKTTSMAMIALWFVYTRKRAKVIVTGPKYEQLKVTTWMEIRKWLYYTGTLSDLLKWSSEELKNLMPGYTSIAKIMTAREKENLAGIHDESVLWVIDEASNVDNVFIDAIMGGLTDPESKIVMAGNPTKATGAFYESFTKYKDMWKVLHFSSEDCARQNPKWLAKMRRLPRDSDPYRVWVLGLPPSGNPLSIISLTDCEAARNRTVEPSDFIEIGLDPASEGNDLSTIAIRQGYKLHEIRAFSKLKAPELIAKVLDVVREYRAKTGIKSRVRVKVDDTGFGNAIRQLLAMNQTDNIEAVPCLFGGKGDEQYTNFGTVMWFNLRDQLHQIELPSEDDDLIEELTSREWQINGNKMMIEPKPRFKERLGRSPDRADACVLCFAKGEKKVFGSGGEESTAAIKEFIIDWDCSHITDLRFFGVIPIDVFHAVSLHLSKDLTLSVVNVFYEFFTSKLWIYDDHVFDIPVPDRVAAMTKHSARIGYYDDNRSARVIGSEEMFRAQSDRRPLSSVLIDAGLNVVEPRAYDEYGAIALGAALFGSGAVTIRPTCAETIIQTALWSVKGGKINNDDSGMCKALLLILSEIRHQIKEHPPTPRRSDYPAIFEEQEKEKERSTAWMGR